MSRKNRLSTDLVTSTKPGALTACPKCRSLQWKPTGLCSRECRECGLVQTVEDLYPEMMGGEV